MLKNSPKGKSESITSKQVLIKLFTKVNYSLRQTGELMIGFYLIGGIIRYGK